MRGKHGRYRPGQPDEADESTAELTADPGHDSAAGVPSAATGAASAATTTASTAAAPNRVHGALWVPGGTTFHPPTVRIAPTPPSLPPIRTAPLPEYTGLVHGADATDSGDAPDEHVEPAASADTAVAHNRADLLAAAAAARLAANFPVSATPAAPVLDAPLTDSASSAAPVTAHTAAPITAPPAVPTASAAPAPTTAPTTAPITAPPAVPTASAASAVPPTASPIVPPTVPPPAAPLTRTDAPVPAARSSRTAVPTLLPSPGQVGTITEHRLEDPILPSKRSAARGSGNERGSGRRRLIFAGVGLLVIAALVAFLLPSSKKATSAKLATPVVSGRTQTTVLIQLSGNFGGAVDSALVAHDSAAKTGTVVLIPSDVIAQVPGFGSMPFGEAITVGDPGAARAALSDLMGVTVDGSWTVTPAAFAALVDKLGGVNVQVDQDVTKVVGDTTTILIAAGEQKLGGAAAVEYASFLAPGETEQARLARFDAVLQQILTELPHDQPTLVTALASLGTASVSSIPVTQLAGVLGGLASDSAASTLTDQLLPVTNLQTGSDQSYSVDATRTAALVSAQLAGSVPASRKVSGNRVYVQNQVGTPGLGESTRDKLARAGFAYVQGENTSDMPNTQDPSAVVIFGQTAAKIAEGRAVAAALGLPASDVKISQVGFAAADVVVKLGVDYKQ